MAKITVQQLAVYAVDQLEAGISSRKVAQKVASYLLDSRQSRELSSVLRAIEATLNKRGSSQVVITSAHEVSETVKQQLASLLGAKSPVFHEDIDPKVIGGVKARFGESEIDLTVRGRLNRFKSVVTRSE
ncbi:MAG TPA: F0F1 ATP synthase subunit delta [Candidatus Saccharibacteria bacterium]|jgi:F0F1-type ATP synthase delta subunit|nr:F0F1 ATP synthase subunit delta [Candidatus Saccharibacteria bacterium]